ncbi:MAG TPA: hypothetical protein VMU47_20055 [Caldimonas sp.]|nr:hypothetical protein [Caldimonas sp.]
MEQSIVYHAIDVADGGWHARSGRAQRVDWNADGTPEIGTSAMTGVALADPSGSSTSGP